MGYFGNEERIPETFQEHGVSGISLRFIPEITNILGDIFKSQIISNSREIKVLRIHTEITFTLYRMMQ